MDKTPILVCRIPRCWGKTELHNSNGTCFCCRFPHATAIHTI